MAALHGGGAAQGQSVEIVGVDAQSAVDQFRRLAQQIPIVGHPQRIRVFNQQVGIIGLQRQGFLVGGQRILDAPDPAIRASQQQPALGIRADLRSEEHTSELQSLMRISYDVFCLKTKSYKEINTRTLYLTNRHSHPPSL